MSGRKAHSALPRDIGPYHGQNSADDVVVLTKERDTGAPLRVADIRNLRRMIGVHSTVLRVNPDGSTADLGSWQLQVGMPLNEVMVGPAGESFQLICALAIKSRRPQIYVPEKSHLSCEIRVMPILADDGNDCHYLVCWTSGNGSVDGAEAPTPLGALRPDEVAVRYRMWQQDLVDVRPWWVPLSAQPCDLWNFPDRLVGIGMASTVVRRLLHQSVEAILEFDEANPQRQLSLRVSLPGADFFNDLLPTLAGVGRASGLDMARLQIAIPVEAMADESSRHLVVHVKSLGIGIELIGLETFVWNLHQIAGVADGIGRSRGHSQGAPLVDIWSDSLSGALSEAKRASAAS